MSLRVRWQYMDRSVTKKYYMDLASVHIIFFGDGPVHILPYDPQCHELFAMDRLLFQLGENNLSLGRIIHSFECILNLKCYLFYEFRKKKKKLED